MGCTSSKEERTPQARPAGTRPQISAPTDPPGMIPVRRRDRQGVPIVPQEFDLSSQNIRRALGYVAQYLHQRGKDLVLIAVGGAVNTVYLQSRQTTHDVDFFNSPMSGSETSLVREAIHYAEERSSVALGGKWLNNETSTIGGTREHIRDLVASARQQNDVIFRDRGLTVLCAPWHYAFTTKIGRITYGTGRSYDMQDAVQYLHQYNRRHGGRAVRAQEIHTWGRMYRRPTPDEILRQANALYQRTYRTAGIVF